MSKDKTPEPLNTDVAAIQDVAEVNEPTRFEVPGATSEAPQFKRAKRELFADGVRAHVAGDLVPTVNVARHGWASDVEDF